MEMVRMPMATVPVHHGASFLSPFQPTTLCPTLRLHTAGAPRRHQANQVKVKVVTTGDQSRLCSRLRVWLAEDVTIFLRG